MGRVLACPNQFVNLSTTTLLTERGRRHAVSFETVILSDLSGCLLLKPLVYVKVDVLCCGNFDVHVVMQNGYVGWWYVQIFGYIMTLGSYSFICTLRYPPALSLPYRFISRSTLSACSSLLKISPFLPQTWFCKFVPIPSFLWIHIIFPQHFRLKHLLCDPTPPCYYITVYSPFPMRLYHYCWMADFQLNSLLPRAAYSNKRLGQNWFR